MNCATSLACRTRPVPGVSAYSAVAALAGRNCTIPELAQSVILTRLGGRPMPDGEELAGLARHGTTMAIFLSAARSGQLPGRIAGWRLSPDTPVVVAYPATWPDELIVECTVGTLVQTVRARKLWKHALLLVGPALAAAGTRSHLYHPGHFHGFRPARSARPAWACAADASAARGAVSPAAGGPVSPAAGGGLSPAARGGAGQPHLTPS